MKINLKRKKQNITNNSNKKTQAGAEIGLRHRVGRRRAGEVKALSRPSAWALAQSRWPEPCGRLGLKPVVSGRGAGRC